jgi:multidrug efflux pump subunit AcrA (membrane-fusion protein)
MRKISLFVLAAGLVLAGCNKGEAKPAAAGGPGAPQEAVVFAVNTAKVERGQINDYLALSGDIVAGSTVDAYSDVAGKVTALFVSVGTRVVRGQRIAEVDPSRPGMTYLPGIATAPIAGTIVSLPAPVGMTISQAVPVARLSGGNALEVKLYVPERFISKIALAQPCEISLDAWPGETFRGSVSEVSPVVDPSSRTMEIHVNVDNTQEKLKAGMFAKVRIITEHKDNIVRIPASAMVSRFAENYVYVVADDPENPGSRIVRRISVKPGLLVDGILEIQEGLSGGDEIVIRGQTLLNDGVRVNVIERTEG